MNTIGVTFAAIGLLLLLPNVVEAMEIVEFDYPDDAQVGSSVRFEYTVRSEESQDYKYAAIVYVKGDLDTALDCIGRPVLIKAGEQKEFTDSCTIPRDMEPGSYVLQTAVGEEDWENTFLIGFADGAHPIVIAEEEPLSLGQVCCVSAIVILGGVGMVFEVRKVRREEAERKNMADAWRDHSQNE